MERVSLLASTLCLWIWLAIETQTAAYGGDLGMADGLVVDTWSSLVGQSSVIPKASWCIALSTVDDSTLQAALDYACGQTTADCEPIMLGAPCFSPNTVLHHASYVFNSYYQMNAKGAGTCGFGGAATVTTQDPSNGTCIFPSSGSLNQTTHILQNDGSRLGPPVVFMLPIMYLLMQVFPGNLMV